MRERAHQLLGLAPGQRAAIVHLLETLLDEDGDTLSPAEAKANPCDSLSLNRVRGKFKGGT